jgi:hypothetical protein
MYIKAKYVLGHKDGRKTALTGLFGQDAKCLLLNIVSIQDSKNKIKRLQNTIYVRHKYRTAPP